MLFIAVIVAMWPLTMAPVRTEAAPQASQASPVFRGGVDLVTVPVTVTDRDRKVVSDLQRQDFVVSDNGRPQEIVTFASEQVPVSLGIVLDASGSMTETRMASARRALTALFDLLGPDDELFLAEFAENTRVLTTWTTDRALLRRALAAVRGGAFTGLYDAVNDSLQIASTGRHQRKALLLISDGDDNSSDRTGKQVRQAIRASDVMVYALGVEGSDDVQGINSGALRDLTDDTGGRTEIVRGFDKLTETVERLAHELRHQYMLTYAPPAGEAGRWRDIKVEVPKRRVTIRARRGYVAR